MMIGGLIWRFRDRRIENVLETEDDKQSGATVTAHSGDCRDIRI
jgi:hypothetical protein